MPTSLLIVPDNGEEERSLTDVGVTDASGVHVTGASLLTDEAPSPLVLARAITQRRR